MNKDALRKLVEAVEAGEVGWNRLAATAEDAMPPKEAALAATAYSGSLDAAKALHEALLPGWKFGMHEPRPGVFRAYVSVWSALRPMPHTEEADTPARAWLLAILKAVEAQP
jgi:hypothetical protein